jgi:hypothetical protein
MAIRLNPVKHQYKLKFHNLSESDPRRAAVGARIVRALTHTVTI